MYIIENTTGKKHKVVVAPVVESDYRKVTKSRYYFNWKTEKKNIVYKLRRLDSDEILGLISLIYEDRDNRIEIKLLSVSKENRGVGKQYERIAGTLIAFACREALRNYLELGCVSLVPKTKLKKHYIDKYGMIEIRHSVFLEGTPLFKMISTYEL